MCTRLKELSPELQRLFCLLLAGVLAAALALYMLYRSVRAQLLPGIPYSRKQQAPVLGMLAPLQVGHETCRAALCSHMARPISSSLILQSLFARFMCSAQFLPVRRVAQPHDRRAAGGPSSGADARAGGEGPRRRGARGAALDAAGAVVPPAHLLALRGDTDGRGAASRAERRLPQLREGRHAARRARGALG